jgi:cell division protein ZapE
MSSEARRFTWLIDVLYDEHIKLVLSAESPPEALFTEGENAADFQRTVSRLHEMQSAEYRLLPVRRVSSAAALGG